MTLLKLLVKSQLLLEQKNQLHLLNLREGQALGASVTLRGKRMYEFLDRLISFSLPRVKDFRGLTLKLLMEKVTTLRY